jgi:hypothetical protein
MQRASDDGGIVLRAGTAAALDAQRRAVDARLASLGLAGAVAASVGAGEARWRLDAAHAANWTPGHDTLQLREHCGLDPVARPADLEREIAIAMLAAPLPLEFPSADEFDSALRMRRDIVAAAQRTALAFGTAAAERPEGWWTYAPESSFTVLPGKPLIEALRRATQPDVSGKLYAFSCYRATEYVLVLAVAQELERSNPTLLAALQRRWERSAIMSGRFHDVFLRELGTNDAPLPPRWYVPGDRIWFRNPDPHSSDASGYEGSWLFYLGGGLFNNFWKRDRPFTMAGKCVELYHWRHATWTDADGHLRIDEAVVEQRTAASMRDPAEVERILAEMLRLRDPTGIDAGGGCIDRTREFPRHVRPGTGDLVVPEA